MNLVSKGTSKKEVGRYRTNKRPQEKKKRSRQEVQAGCFTKEGNGKRRLLGTAHRLI